MRSLKLTIASIGLLAGMASTASAQINFDDFSPSPFAMLSNGYQGLNWDNAFVINPTGWFGSASVAGGFNTALTSGGHVASNAGAQALTISSGSAFDLNGGTFAALWKSGLGFNAKGYASGAMMYDQTYSLDWNTAQHLSLNMFGIDQVVFTSTGGTYDTYSDGNTGFAFDDLDIGEAGPHFVEQSLTVAVVPEPMTMSLVGAGLLLVGMANARRRRVSAARE